MKPALDDNALSWAQRSLWAICIGVYLCVFLGGLEAGGDELLTMGRAVALTVAAAVLGKIALGLLAKASLRQEQGPSADQPGPVGSLVDLVASTNVGQQHEDTASPA